MCKICQPEMRSVEGFILYQRYQINWTIPQHGFDYYFFKETGLYIKTVHIPFRL